MLRLGDPEEKPKIGRPNKEQRVKSVLEKRKRAKKAVARHGKGAAKITRRRRRRINESAARITQRRRRRIGGSVAYYIVGLF